MTFLIVIVLITSLSAAFPRGIRHKKKGSTKGLVFSYLLYLVGYCVFVYLGIFEGLVSTLELGGFYMFVLFSVYMVFINTMMGFRYKMEKAIIVVLTVLNCVAFVYLVIFFIMGLPQQN